MGYGSILSRSRKASSFYPTIRIVGVTGDKIPTIQKGEAVAIAEAVGSNYIAKPWSFGEYEVKVDGVTIAKVKVTQLIEYSVAAPSNILNDCSWETIRIIADQGAGGNYWNVGDAKTIVINGLIQGTTFGNITVNAFIIGIDHNSNIEGTNRIHFQIGKTTNGIDIALCDRLYDNTVEYTGFCMNLSDTNVGGWNGSYGRKTLLGNSGTPILPPANSFMAALPSDLRVVMKDVTKYTDNTGGGSTAASNVTATTDYFFLLSEYEVFGSVVYGNSNESNEQAQYAYYSAGNSKIKYKHNDTSATAYWWGRSPLKSNSHAFVFVGNSGTLGSGYAYLSLGLAPGFCV